MSRYNLTPQAQSDLLEIALRIAQDNVDAAARVVKEIEKAMDALVDHPMLGHTREDLAGSDHRFWILYSYLIIYRSDTNPLQVVRILHASRDIADIL